jgi:hypothetical protein
MPVVGEHLHLHLVDVVAQRPELFEVVRFVLVEVLDLRGQLPELERALLREAEGGEVGFGHGTVC